MRTVGRRKITYGHVVQTFDDDGKCIEQEFVAGDQVDWEDEALEPIDADEDCEYQNFDMVQPIGKKLFFAGGPDEWRAFCRDNNLTPRCEFCDEDKPGRRTTSGHEEQCEFCGGTGNASIAHIVAIKESLDLYRAEQYDRSVGGQDE